MDKMRCDLDPSQIACFYDKKRQMQFSASSLQQLEDKKLLKLPKRITKPIFKSHPVPELCASSGVISGSFRGANRSVHQVVQGISDFAIEPVQGFRDDSLKGGVLGFGKGLTKVVYKGLDSPLLFCEELSIGSFNFSTSLNPMMNDANKKAFRPKNTLDGTLIGTRYLFQGCAEGFTDVFVLPIKGGSKGGFVGGIEGLGLGFCSVLTKPISGVGLFFTMPFAGFRKSVSSSSSSPS